MPEVVEDVAGAAYWRERGLRAEAELAETRALLEQVRVEHAADRERIRTLTEQVAVLSRMMFGRSSEKARPGGGFGAEGDGESGAAGGQGGAGGEGEAKKPRGQQPGSKGHGRRAYPGLRTREEFHDVPAGERCCAGCGQAFESLGTDDSDQIDWQVTITRVVHRRRRYRRACSCPGPKTITAAPAPKPVRKGLFTAGFLARLLYEKYALGLPVYRIAKALGAEGFPVPEGTLAGALHSVVALLDPLEKAITARNAQGVHVHADETSWRVYEKVQDKEGHKWWLWVFIAEDTVVFRMDPTRSTTVLDTHFGIDRKVGHLEGGRERLVLSTDFFTAYQSLARVDGVDPLWCWAHIRRYFIRAGDAHKAQLGGWRDAWVTRIADLYLAHRAMAAEQPATSAYTAAQTTFEQALQVIDTVRHEQGRSPGLHPAAKKVLATLEREWDGLVRHRDFPDLPLDNNISERALRGPVVGRKNYYGSHARWSADLAAAVWTISATVERHGLEPLTFLSAYLTACAQAGGQPPQGAAFDAFLPWIRDPNDPTGSQDHDPPPISASGPAP